MAKIWLKRKFTGTHQLLLGLAAFHHLGLLHDIPGTYTIKAFEVKVPPPSLRSKDDVLEVYPNLFKGLAKLNDDANHYATTSSRRVPLPLIVVVPWPNGDIRMYVGLINKVTPSD